LRNQLHYSENFPESVLSYGLEAAGFGSRGIDLCQYRTSDDLTSMLNGYHLLLFDVVEEETGGLKNYEDLVKWLSKSSTKNASMKAYSSIFYSQTLSTQIVEELHLTIE
jgi:hypothetical protein